MDYLSLVKGLVQTGSEYISQMRPNYKKEVLRIDKSQTLYEARSFNENQLEPEKLCRVIKHLIYHFNCGEAFSEEEANFLFFGITKLFFWEDPALRRSTYMVIKEMAAQPSIYIVTSSLMKDIHHKNPHFRRNSLRVIPMVIDPSNLVQVDRYIKNLLNDKDESVASGALISGLHMFSSNEEMVRKWGAEVVEKLKSKDQYVQYHALILIGETKRKDVTSLKKILFSLMKQDLKGVAAVQHLRMLKAVSRDIDYDSSELKDFVNFVNRQVRSKNDAVAMEAARLGCESPLFSNKDLVEVIKMLEPHLTTKSTIKKYSVLKMFHSILKNPSRKNLIVNVREIEKVLEDNNTSLSSIAASILLRICSENYLEKLFAKIEKTMGDLSNDYKIDVVRSLVGVLKNYPNKFEAVNGFLTKLLQKESSFELKSEIIKVFSFQIEEQGGVSRKECLKLLSGYLSSAIYEKIHFQILGVISREATKEDVDSELIKNIICEIYLQEGAVRACGLSTLIKVSQFSERQEALRKTIRKFEKDPNEEVQARIRLSGHSKVQRISRFELDLIENYLNFNCKEIQASEDQGALSLQRMKTWGEEVGPSLIKASKKSTKHVEAEKSEEEDSARYREIFSNHSTFQNYGPLRKINKEVHISDPDSEFQAWARVFLFEENIVVEYRIENRFKDTVLEKVKIELKHSEEFFEVQHTISAKQIREGGQGECYVGLKRLEDCEQLLCEDRLSSIAKYTVKEMAGEKVRAEYQDEYALEDFEIKLATYISPWHLEPEDFSKQWEMILGEESNNTFQLKYSSTEAAQQELVRHLGMRVIEVPENIAAASAKNMVSVSLAGKYLGRHEILVVLLLAYDTKMGCLLKIKVKCSNSEISEEVVLSIE